MHKKSLVLLADGRVGGMGNRYKRLSKGIFKIFENYNIFLGAHFLGTSSIFSGEQHIPEQRHTHLFGNMKWPKYCHLLSFCLQISKNGENWNRGNLGSELQLQAHLPWSGDFCTDAANLGFVKHRWNSRNLGTSEQVFRAIGRNDFLKKKKIRRSLRKCKLTASYQKLIESIFRPIWQIIIIWLSNFSFKML